MSFATKYTKSLTKQWNLRFKTRHPEGDSYDGVVTHVKSGFIVLREERDFEFDGVVILPKKYINGCRDGRFERCSNEILRQTSALKKARSPRWLDSCGTLPELFTEIKQRDIWPGVEILFNQGRETAFYIGPIMSTTAYGLVLMCYDAAGDWEKQYALDYAEVFKVEFDSKYCNRFNAYMRSKRK